MGGDTTVFNPDLPFAFIGNASLAGLPVLALIALVVILASWFVLRRTVLGVRIYAVGGNPAAARLSGIKVWAILLFVYCLSGFLAGLGGVMSAARLFAANGLQIGQGYELDAIAAVILGGTSFVGGIGSIWGTLIGALIIAVLTNGLILTGVSDIWQFIIKGLVIIGAVALDRYRTAGQRPHLSAAGASEHRPAARRGRAGRDGPGGPLVRRRSAPSMGQAGREANDAQETVAGRRGRRCSRPGPPPPRT